MAWKETNETAGGSGGSGWWDTIKSGAQTAVDFGTAAAHTATFGLDVRRDALAGWLAGDYPDYSTGLAAEQQKLEKQRQRSPVASIAGDIAGAAAIPGMGGAGLAARGALGLRGGSLGARALGYGAEGAAIGAAQGAGNTYTGNVEDYAKNALLGGVLGGVTGGAVGGAFGPRGQVSSARPTTLDEVRRGTDAAYDALRANPTRYDAGQFRTAADQLEQRLLNAGYIRNYSPGAFAAVDRMRLTQGQPNAVVTPANIDLIRQGVNRIPRGEASAVDRSAGRVVKETLDDFVVNPPTGAVLSNPQVAAEAAQTARLAREMRAAQERQTMIGNVRGQAELAAQSANSGRNIDNAYRQVTKNYLLSPISPSAQARLARYSPEEQAALRNIPDPNNRFHNTVRTLGNMGGGGGGIGTPLLALLGAGAAGGGVGYAMGGDKTNAALGGLALAGGGLGLRSMANRLGRGRIQAAEEMIARRNPLYQQRAANAPMVPRPSALSGPRIGDQTANVRDALTYQLLRMQGMPQTGE